MTLQEIKSAVDSGQTVHWANSNYKVVKDKNGDYLIGFNIDGRNPNYIGLTWRDGVTLNGKEEDFFISNIPVGGNNIPPHTSVKIWT